MAQVLRLNKKVNNQVHLNIETYEYGTDKIYKTFTQAHKQAVKDFRKEVNLYIKKSFEFSVECEITITNELFEVTNLFKIKSK